MNATTRIPLVGALGQQAMLVCGLVFLLLHDVGRAESPTNAPRPAPTSDPISIAELVQQVEQGNPELKFYVAELAAARVGRAAAGRWENPEITAELGSKRVWERHGPALGDGVAWSVAVAQPFEWPGRLALRKAIADRQIEIAELGLHQFAAALAARARSLAYGVLAARQRADAAQEVAARYRAVLEVVVQRDPAGVAPMLEQRILEAGAITMQRRASEAEDEVRSALLELNQLRGQPADAPLTLVGQITVPTNVPPLARLLEVALTNNFEIRQRQVELAQQGFQVRLARHERYPRVTLAPFYSVEKADTEERIVGVGISVPLPVWNRKQEAVATARIREEQADTALRVMCRAVERQVTEHALALQTRLAEIAAWRPDARARLREAAELADRHYRLGAVPLSTYLEMQARYLEAVEVLGTTEREALEHRQQLELLVGHPLDSLLP